MTLLRQILLDPGCLRRASGCWGISGWKRRVILQSAGGAGEWDQHLIGPFRREVGGERSVQTSPPSSSSPKPQRGNFEPLHRSFDEAGGSFSQEGCLEKEDELPGVPRPGGGNEYQALGVWRAIDQIHLPIFSIIEVALEDAAPASLDFFLI